MLLTVTQIAQRLAKPEQQAALRERIRHWTREGLIKPIGEKKPWNGTSPAIRRRCVGGRCYSRCPCRPGRTGARSARGVASSQGVDRGARD